MNFQEIICTRKYRNSTFLLYYMYRGISTKEGEILVRLHQSGSVNMNVLGTMKVLLIVYEGHCFYIHFHYWRWDCYNIILCGHLSHP